jgi:hypothetical protein
LADLSSATGEESAGKLLVLTSKVKI